MSLDITLLQVLKYRERYDRLARSVPKHVLDAHTQTLLADIGAYFSETSDERLPHEGFFTFFKLRHPTLTPEQFSAYEHLLKQVQSDPGPELEGRIMERLVAADTAYTVAALLQKWNQGDEVDLYVALRDAVDNYENTTARKVKLPRVTTTIAEMLAEEESDSGLRWRLAALNMSMRPLRGGDFGVIAGRPDKGKTTFLSSELTFMAKQVAEMYGNERQIVWLNNEGPGKRIIQRNYQSALNLTIPEMVELHNKPSTKGFAHLLDEMYAEALGGRIDMIDVHDIHGFWSHEVEDILRKVPAGLVVWDMVDNVQFGGGASNGGQRTDQLLEAMYQWVRVLCVKYDIPMLATSQISAEGENERWPKLSQLKDSRTGKQGAAEFIITLGAIDGPDFEHSRFVGMTKNKLHRYGGPKDPRAEVLFDGARGRYNMAVHL